LLTSGAASAQALFGAPSASGWGEDFFCSYIISKFTGANSNWGNPPLATNWEIASRAKGNNTFGQAASRIFSSGAAS